MYLCSTIQKSEEDAIYQTMEDRDELACIIMDISPDANLDRFFRPLENNRSSEMILGKEKGRPHRRSWLRLYAIKLSVGIYNHHRWCHQIDKNNAREGTHFARIGKDGESEELSDSGTCI